MLDRIDQIDAMRLGVDYRASIRLRGYELQVRPLSLSETVTVAGRVGTRLRDLPAGQRNALAEHTILAMETLVLASTSDVDANDPKISELILQRMTPEEVQGLFKQYVCVVDRANPCLELMKAPELAELVEELKKSPQDPKDLVFRLTELSFSELVSISHSFLTTSDSPPAK